MMGLKVMNMKVIEPPQACPLFAALLLLAAAAGCTVNEPPVEHLSGHVPRPVVDVQIAPTAPVDLKKASVLMAPVFLADRQEELWRDSVTRLVHSILLQENAFGTIEVSKDLVPTLEKLYREAATRGFDYLLLVDFSPILVSACNTPGWLGITLKLISTTGEQTFTLWQIYGEAILSPQPTMQGLLGLAQPRLAPTVGQGISVITRSMARIMRGPGTGLVRQAALR